MNPLNLPRLTKHVTDLSDILDNQQVEVLSAKFADHENTTTEQVLTVLIPHRQWYELRDIWLKLFNENGIGQKGLNNWLLLIIVTNEQKIRIITGKWMELKYTQMICRDIIEKHLRPLLNEGRYITLIDTWYQIINGTIDVWHDDTIISQDTPITTTWIWTEGLIGVTALWPFSALFWALIIDGPISGSIWIIIWIWLSIFIYILRDRFWKKLFYIAAISPICLIIIGIFGLLVPAKCIPTRIESDGWQSYACERTILDKTYTYSKTLGGSSSSSSSDSDWWSSSSSSFGGGGGSSNGGGYGD